MESLLKLNLVQFYLQRFGLGMYIAKSIIKCSGVHYSFKVKSYLPNVINQEIKYIFIKSVSFLDLLLEQSMIKKIKKDLILYTYRGDRYKLRLPLNGQRRRSNSKTVKKVRPLII